MSHECIMLPRIFHKEKQAAFLYVMWYSMLNRMHDEPHLCVTIVNLPTCIPYFPEYYSIAYTKSVQQESIVSVNFNNQNMKNRSLFAFLKLSFPRLCRSSRLMYNIMCGSVILSHDLEWDNFLLASLRPGIDVHFVGLHWEHLVAKYRDLEAHVSETAAQALSTTERYMTLLSPLGLSCYYLKLAQSWASLITWKVEGPSYDTIDFDAMVLEGLSHILYVEAIWILLHMAMRVVESLSTKN